LTERIRHRLEFPFIYLRRYLPFELLVTHIGLQNLHAADRAVSLYFYLHEHFSRQFDAAAQ
jgi:hypothetical protein